MKAWLPELDDMRPERFPRRREARVISASSQDLQDFGLHSPVQLLAENDAMAEPALLLGTRNQHSPELGYARVSLERVTTIDRYAQYLPYEPYAGTPKSPVIAKRPAGTRSADPAQWPAAAQSLRTPGLIQAPDENRRAAAGDAVPAWLHGEQSEQLGVSRQPPRRSPKA